MSEAAAGDGGPGTRSAPDELGRPMAMEPVETSVVTPASTHQRNDWVVDEWGQQSFPASDPPANW